MQPVALLPSDDGTGVAQWHLSYQGNAAYHVQNVNRLNNAATCNQNLLSCSA